MPRISLPEMKTCKKDNKNQASPAETQGKQQLHFTDLKESLQGAGQLRPG